MSGTASEAASTPSTSKVVKKSSAAGAKARKKEKGTRESKSEAPKVAPPKEAKQDPLVAQLLKKTGVKWEPIPYRRDRVRLTSGSDARLYELDSDDQAIRMKA